MIDVDKAERSPMEGALGAGSEVGTLSGTHSGRQLILDNSCTR